MRLLRLNVLLLLLAIIFIAATPVCADTELPDSTPTLEGINIYRNLRETGDWLVLLYANIPYATTPDLPVTQTFTWRLIDTDNTTELGSTTGYAYNDDGYGYNVYSMYFDADNVTGTGLTWGTNYIIRLSGNPTAFDDPPIYNYTVSTADYSSLTATADVKAELAARILELADTLDNIWGLSTTYSLITQGEAGIYLSTFGSAFFRGAIFGIQAMAPAVFDVVIEEINIEARTWSSGYADNLTTQYDGTWIDTAIEAGKVLFGTDYDLLSMIMLFVMAGALMVGNVMLTGDAWNGMIDVSVLGVIGSRLGMVPLGFVILFAALCWLYIGVKLWFGLLR